MQLGLQAIPRASSEPRRYQVSIKVVSRPADAGIQRQRRGIVVEPQTKMISLAPLGPAASGKNAQLPIVPCSGSIRLWTGFLLAPRTSGAGICG